jgi:hypothetical protein
MSEPSMAISVENDELVTVRDAMRTLNRIVDDLSVGHPHKKSVLMKHNQIVAVVLPLDGYRNLLADRFDPADSVSEMSE